MYLETVIPTLLNMQKEEQHGIPALGDSLRIVYLAADSGKEWLYRLVAREPDKLPNEHFRKTLTGRVESSLQDMEIAARERIPTAVHVLDYGPITAKRVLAGWDIL
ncbi:MAG: hypothetical protein ACMXYE_03700 [Candidatus Woesearchaeota archaeon]